MVRAKVRRRGDAAWVALDARLESWMTFSTSSSGPLPGGTDTGWPCLLDLCTELGISPPSSFLLF